jgi:ABC-type polar amino acid transport system ATPase subunit
MGVNKKEHRKKVKARNARIRAEEKQVEKLRRVIFEEAKQRYYDNLSGNTQQTFQIKL